jgi:hypothetical protein
LWSLTEPFVANHPTSFPSNRAIIISYKVMKKIEQYKTIKNDEIFLHNERKEELKN